MPKKWIQLTLIASLLILLAACTGTEQAATATSAPPAREESQDAPPEADSADTEQEAEDPEAEAETEEEESSAAAIDAAAIYGSRCARCHGADRVSGSAPDLIPAQLTGSKDAYVSIITNGSGPMPGFGSRLSAEEISALVDYLLSPVE